MKKKSVVSILVMAAVILGILSYNQFFSSIVPASVVTGGYRDGISLIPVSYDSTGIAVDTDILIEFEKDKALSIETVKEQFKSEPEGDYDIVEKNGDIMVSIVKPLEKGTIYKFSIGEVSWTFATQSEFQLLGSLPGNQTTNVPMNSGIELYFTHQGAQVSSYFEIEPKVDGTFENHGNGIIFVPKGLEAKTLYTVTLKAGLPLSESDEVLKEDYTFSFETSDEEGSAYEEPIGYFNYSRLLNDFSTSEEIYIPFNYSIYSESEATNNDIESNIYRLEDAQSAIDRIDTYYDRPLWSNYNNATNEVDTKGLTKVLTMSQPIDYEGWETGMVVGADLDAGYYLIVSQWKDITFSTMFQITDLSAYLIEDHDKAYFWSHNLLTGKEVGTLDVVEMNTDTQGKKDDQGMVYVNKEKLLEEENIYYHLNGAGMELLMYRPKNYEYSSTGDSYWRYLQTDRNLYKPEDVIKFYGFFKNRSEGQPLDKVTLQLQQQNVYYYSTWPNTKQDMPLVSQEIELNNGFINGEMSIPGLSEGYYQLVVLDGDEVLARTAINVEKYVKPDYKMSMTKDKEAVFVGEPVRFELEAQFFEGTPVPNVPVQFTAYGVSWENGEGVTDKEGKASFDYTPMDENQFHEGSNPVFAGVSASVVFPESGELYGNEDILVFLNDIDVDVNATLEEEKGQVEVTVNSITLDRLNDKTAEDENDYLDQPMSDHTLNAVIYRHEWIKTETGEVYDYINKLTKKTYEYDEQITTFKTLSLVTDSKGVAVADVLLPKEDNVFYTVEVTTKDQKDRQVKIERNFSLENPSPYISDRILLEGVEESYHIGDGVNLTMMAGEVPLEAKSYLFVEASNGIIGKQHSDSNAYSSKFAEDMVPNVKIRGIAFNGKGYVVSNDGDLVFDYDSNRISLEVEQDKEVYKPGEAVNISFKATYEEGEKIMPVTDGMVNISVVDEALYALYDQDIRTLEELYSRVGSGIAYEKGSHQNSNDSMMFGTMRFNESMEMDKGSSQAMADENVMTQSTGTGSGTEIRSIFEDTAIFASVQLNEDGEGQLSFKLPDNITSWRLTASAVSNSLRAGTDKQQMNVTLPFFINTNVNSTYLVGDKPSVGVAAYGSDLKNGEKVTYVLSCEEKDFTSIVEGAAYEKVYLPLWQLEKGSYEVVVTATTQSGLKDAYTERIEVVDTYQSMNVSETYDAVKGMKIDSNDNGLTNITFSDKSIGQYVPSLYSLAFSSGNRVDQRFVAYEAAEMLVDSFGVDNTMDVVTLDSYIGNDGGVSLLPYSEADLETTVKLIPYITNPNQLNGIVGYLNIKSTSESVQERAIALYGLALAKEPVLLQVNNLYQVENLDITSSLYIALAYSALGDKYMANTIYDEVISDKVEKYDQIARVVISDSEEESIEMTSKVLPLVAALDVEESASLFEYVNKSNSKDYLSNLDCLTYIGTKIKGAVRISPSITYAYEGEPYSIDFGNEYARTITLPSSKIGTFEILDTSSEVLMIVNYDSTQAISKEMDENVSVSRHFEHYESGEEDKTFETGEIVKVVVDWEVKDQAIDDVYRIVDYAPSGLVPLKNAMTSGVRYEDDRVYSYLDIDGQSVTFYVNKDTENYEPFTYYARVVTPGTFIGDKPLIQGEQIKDSYNKGNTQIITIMP